MAKGIQIQIALQKLNDRILFVEERLSPVFGAQNTHKNNP